MTKFKTLFIFLFITLFSFNITFGQIEDDFYVNKFQHYEYLRSIALEKGSVKVIAKLDIPSIEELTIKSNRFKTGIEEFTLKSKKFKKELNEVLFQQERQTADMALENAISAVTHYMLLRLEGFSHKINHTFTTIPFLAIEVSPEALDELYYMLEVIFIQEDELIMLPEPQEIESTEIGFPALNQSRKLVGAIDAWNLGFTGDGWYVAVLDTGILSTHEMFTGKHIVEQCYSLLRDCPNGLKTMSGPGAAAHKYSSNGWDHGTHVSGIAAGNNKNGFFGVAKDANIIACQIFSEYEGSPGAYVSDQVKGLEYVYTKRTMYKIAAVNMSIGGGYTRTICDSYFGPELTAISNLRNAGIATIVATGNDGYCGYISAPACISSAIAIGASSKSDVEANFNNWSDTLMDFFAPGISIRSARGNYNTSYAFWNGTSMATPHVAGAWAILKQLLPNTGVNEIYNGLVSTGKMIQTTCRNSNESKPRINIDTTLQLLGKTLVTSASSGGTTDPAPGNYLYERNQQVSVRAFPEDYHVFNNWSGNASGTNNPFIITMQENKSIKANFRPVLAPSNFSGSKSTNRNLFQIEYINTLSWIANPDNQGINIAKYKIFLIDGSTVTELIEVNNTSFTYMHRQAGKDPQEYAIVIVLPDDRIGYASYITVQ